MQSECVPFSAALLSRSLVEFMVIRTEGKDTATEDAQALSAFLHIILTFCEDLCRQGAKVPPVGKADEVLSAKEAASSSD